MAVSNVLFRRKAASVFRSEEPKRGRMTGVVAAARAKVIDRHRRMLELSTIEFFILRPARISVVV